MNVLNRKFYLTEIEHLKNEGKKRTILADGNHKVIHTFYNQGTATEWREGDLVIDIYVIRFCVDPAQSCQGQKEEPIGLTYSLIPQPEEIISRREFKEGRNQDEISGEDLGGRYECLDCHAWQTDFYLDNDDGSGTCEVELRKVLVKRKYSRKAELEKNYWQIRGVRLEIKITRSLHFDLLVQKMTVVKRMTPNPNKEPVSQLPVEEEKVFTQTYEEFCHDLAEEERAKRKQLPVLSEEDEKLLASLPEEDRPELKELFLSVNNRHSVHLTNIRVRSRMDRFQRPYFIIEDENEDSYFYLAVSYRKVHEVELEYKNVQGKTGIYQQVISLFLPYYDPFVYSLPPCPGFSFRHICQRCFTEES
ncbi:2822_t:CDS:2, partial [Gigaspora margarita]